MRRHPRPRSTAPLTPAAALLVLAACSANGDLTSSTASGAGGAAGAGGTGGTGQGGAGGTGQGAGVRPLFVIPSDVGSLGSGCSVDGLTSRSGDCFSSFFDHPFPSDLRRDEGGKVRLAGFPNPRKIPLLSQYIATGDRLLDGFSPQATGYLRFSGPIDAQGLPADPGAGLSPGASVQLIDVDDASPERGQRRLVTLYYRESEGAYWAPSTLAFQPTFGFPLRPATRYALVVTDALRAKGGGAIEHSSAIDAVLARPSGPAPGGAAALGQAWAPALANLDAAGVDRAAVVHLTVFTTDDPTAELVKIRDDVHASVPPPAAHEGAWVAGGRVPGVLDVYEGVYGPSPDYQHGNVPFTDLSDDGSFVFAPGGAPVVQRMFDLRFALAVPDAAACPVPPSGYPVVLYAHGTGGNFHSYLHDGTAEALAAECVASMGIDQIFHGTRPGAPAGASNEPIDPGVESQIEVLFFNFQNPLSARTNGRQAAVDEVQRARLFTDAKLSVPAAVSRSGAAIAFDPAKVLFFGHSQGGQNGPLFLAIDDSARGGVLSGSGSVLGIALLEKTKPTPSVSGLVRTVFLGLHPAEYEELNAQHPALALAQMLVDPVDPIHYVGHIIQAPRAGFAPKSILQTEGVNPDGTGDSYAPPHGIEVGAVATGLPLMKPVIHPVAEMAFGALGPPVDIPPAGLAGNLAGGLASGVLAQWPASQASDGHFVVFDIDAARKQAARFCRNLADDPHGRVPAP